MTSSGAGILPEVTGSDCERGGASVRRPAPGLKTQQAVTGNVSALRRYQDVVVGRSGLGAMLYFELCSWLGGVPGALGLVLRKVFWPRLFASCGPGTVFGVGVTLRHPGRIHLGARVVVSEGCVLDARSLDQDAAMEIGDDVILANHCVVSGKGAKIRIGPRTGLGPHSVVIATHENDVEIGADCPLGPRTTIIGGGNYNTDRTDLPMWRQGIKPGLPVRIEDDVWFGAGVSALGGSHIGSGSIAAAGAVITGEVEPMALVGGIPARSLKGRHVTCEDHEAGGSAS